MIRRRVTACTSLDGKITVARYGDPLLESLFRFLFEYRPVVFQQGEFRFAPTSGRTPRLAIAAVAAFMAFSATVGRASG